MSDRLEELGVPPKLLAAIRNEVRTNIEQQLNDLWMVVHSIKDASGKAGEQAPGPDPAALDEIKAQVQSISDDLQKKVRGLRKKLEELPGQEALQPLQLQLQQLQAQLDNKIKELSERPPEASGGAASLPSELTNLPDKVQGMLDRLEKVEIDKIPGMLDRVDKVEREKVQSLIDRLDKMERETGQLGGAAALFESRLVDLENRLARRLEDAGALVESRLVEQETRQMRRLDETETRLRGATSQTRSPGSGEDDLSTEHLLSLAGSVDFSLADLAKVAIKYNASDLIIRPNSLPYTYLEGDLIPIGQQPLTAIDSYRVAMLSLQPNERKQLLKERAFSKLVEYHSARFLLNAYFERGELAVYARRLTPPGLNLDQLDLPRALEVSLLEERGLILLCGGASGSLKGVAYALLQPINQQRRARIFTLEDAVSFELPEEQSLLSQLQRGLDITRASDLLRLKPDVLYLQRIASSEELQVALSFASDRTLVIASCPGAGAIQCVQHLLELASPEHRGSILGQLGVSLRSILCYRHPQPNEYLINSAKVRPWLERGDLAALQTAVETNQPGSRPRPASTPSSGKPADSGPLPPPSSESLAAVKSNPSPPATPPAQAAQPAKPVNPPPSSAPPTQSPGKPTRPPLEPPPDEPPQDKSGGDEETLLGWL